jgi:hypothetical protein
VRKETCGTAPALGQKGRHCGSCSLNFWQTFNPGVKHNTDFQVPFDNQSRTHLKWLNLQQNVHDATEVGLGTGHLGKETTSGNEARERDRGTENTAGETVTEVGAVRNIELQEVCVGRPEVVGANIRQTKYP